MTCISLKWQLGKQLIFHLAVRALEEEEVCLSAEQKIFPYRTYWCNIHKNNDSYLSSLLRYYDWAESKRERGRSFSRSRYRYLHEGNFLFDYFLSIVYWITKCYCNLIISCTESLLLIKNMMHHDKDLLLLINPNHCTINATSYWHVHDLLSSTDEESYISEHDDCFCLLNHEFYIGWSNNL